MTAKIRKCLKCLIPFRSEGKHNRICNACKNSKAWREGGDTTYNITTPGSSRKAKE